MISHPIGYYRNYTHDFPALEANQFAERALSITRSALPLLTLHKPFRAPLSLTLGSLRTVAHIQNFFTSKNAAEATFHLCQTTLSTAAVAYSYLLPSVGMLLTSTGDALENIRKLLIEKDTKAALYLTMDLLFIVSLSYATIETTIACMALHILLESHQAYHHFQEGKWVETCLRMLFVGFQTQQMLPQIKFLSWKWEKQPTFEGTLRQDGRGFVYLDVPDEYVQQLQQLYQDLGMELPPYFGEGRAGAHITVMTKEEGRGISLKELGQKISFNVAGIDTVEPEGWNGVNRVWYVLSASAELEAIRASYGFTPKVAEHHDFHITFGIKKY